MLKKKHLTISSTKLTLIENTDRLIAAIIAIGSMGYMVHTGISFWGVSGVLYGLFSAIGWGLFKESKNYDIICKEAEE